MDEIENIANDIYVKTGKCLENRMNIYEIFNYFEAYPEMATYKKMN